MMGLEIKRLVVGSLEVNCYIAYDPGTGEAMVVDPGDESAEIMDRIRESELTVRYLVCTHGHFDHVGAIPQLSRSTGAKVAIHREEKPVYLSAKDFGRMWGFEIDELPEPDLLLAEGDHIRVGELKFDVLHTPGHSPGGICLYGEKVLFSGDTIFAGSVGRTDFPGGSAEMLRQSFRRILNLPGETRIYPGHGPSSTVETERRENFFIHEL